MAGVRVSPGHFYERKNMKKLGCLTGLIALCVLKAGLVWGIWLTVVGALALIGAARVLFVWRNRMRENSE
jgi:hypothetical protein